MRPFWILQRDATPTHHIGAQRVTPVVQSIGLRWRGGGWLWQFPLAVKVANDETGEETRIPIPDITRAVVLFLYALTLTVIVVAFLQRRRNMSSRKD